MPWFDNMGWRRKAGGEKWTIKTIKNEKWTIKTIVKWTVLLISPSQSQCHLLLERSFPPLSLPSWWTAWHCRPLILCFQSSHSEQGTGTTDKPKFSLTDSLTLFDAFLFSQTCLKFYRIEATLRWCPQGCISLRTKCQTPPEQLPLCSTKVIDGVVTGMDMEEQPRALRGTQEHGVPWDQRLSSQTEGSALCKPQRSSMAWPWSVARGQLLPFWQQLEQMASREPKSLHSPLFHHEQVPGCCAEGESAHPSSAFF